MNKLVSVEHKVEQSLYGASPATMKFMRKSHRSTKMLAARKMLSELVVKTEVSKGWGNVIRSGDSISKREFRTLVCGLGENTALACVIRDVISYDGRTSMKNFFGGVTKHGVRHSKILEELDVDSVSFRFDLAGDSAYAFRIDLLADGARNEACECIKNAMCIADDIVPANEITALSSQNIQWSLNSIIDHLCNVECGEENGSGIHMEWRVMHNVHKDIVITLRDNELILYRGKRFKDCFNWLEIEPTRRRSCLVTEGFTRSEPCFTQKDDETYIEGRIYRGNYFTIVSNMRAESGAGLIGSLKYKTDGGSSEGVISSVAVLIGPVKSLMQLVMQIETAQSIYRNVVSRVISLIGYLLDSTKGYKVIAETISSMRELTGINQDYTYQYNMDVLMYGRMIEEAEILGKSTKSYSEKDVSTAEEVLMQLKGQTEPTQELIMKEVMKSVIAGEIDYMTSSGSSIDRMWLDQFYGTDDESRIKLSKGKTCVVDAFDNYYVSIPSSKLIYIYYKDSGGEICDMGSEYQSFKSKSSLVTNRALVELCCVFKPSVTAQGSLTIDPYKIAKNRKRAESGLIYMLGRRCEDIAEDISRDKIIWDERRIRISKMRLNLIPAYLKETYDREWFMREIVASYIKAGMRFSNKSQYQCYAQALGGVGADSGGFEFDVPMSLEGVEARRIKGGEEDQIVFRSGKIDLVESKHTWAGKSIYNARAASNLGRVEKATEKMPLSGFVGGSDHAFDSAALFRAVRTIAFARSSEVDNILEVGSAEYTSVEYIKELYATDKGRVKEIFSKLGYSSPEIIHKVLKNGKVVKTGDKKCVAVDRNRVLAVIANKVCKMNAEVDGSEPVKIDESEAVGYLEENIEEHGTYVKFLAGLFGLGDVGTVDEIIGNFRKERKESMDQRVRRNKSKIDRQIESEGKEDVRKLSRLSIMMESVTGRVARIFVITDVMESHPYVIAKTKGAEEVQLSDESRRKGVSPRDRELTHCSPTAGERGVYGSIEKNKEGAKEEPEKEDIIHYIGSVKASEGTRTAKKRRSRRVRSDANGCNSKGEITKRKKKKLTAICMIRAGKRVKVLIDEEIRDIIEKIGTERIRQSRRVRSKTKGKIFKNPNGRDSGNNGVIKTEEVCWTGVRRSITTEKTKNAVLRSCLREMVKTRRTHFKTKRRASVTYRGRGQHDPVRVSNR